VEGGEGGVGEADGIAVACDDDFFLVSASERGVSA
jgi:hypothetical protein